ncbi:MAG: hypothetical protein WCG80_03305 [Spirochaetales bacterium]
MLRACVFLLVLTSCSTPVFYHDAVLRLAAPEILQAWDSRTWPVAQARVEVASGDLTAVSKDLASRQPPPSAVLLGLNVPEVVVKQWKVKYPSLRVARFVPQGHSSTESSLLRVNRRANWEVLVRAAAQGQHKTNAVALVPSTAGVEEITTLRDAWRSVTGGGSLALLAAGAPVPADVSDLFVLDGSSGIPSLSGSPQLRVHTGLGITVAEARTHAGWGLRIDASAAGKAIDNVLAAGPEKIVDLPVQAVPRTVALSS